MQESSKYSGGSYPHFYSLLSGLFKKLRKNLFTQFYFYWFVRRTSIQHIVPAIVATLDLIQKQICLQFCFLTIPKNQMSWKCDVISRVLLKKHFVTHTPIHQSCNHILIKIVHEYLSQLTWYTVLENLHCRLIVEIRVQLPRTLYVEM